MLLMLAMLNL